MVLKIALVCHDYAPEKEGISVSLTRLAENLPSDCEIHIIAGRASCKKVDFLKTEIVTKKQGRIFIHEVKINVDIKSEDYIWGLENLLFGIRKLNEQYKFCILHAYYLTPCGYITTLASKLTGVPCIVGIRGNDIARDVLDYKQFHWIEWTLKNSNYITALNSELLELANAIYPIHNKAKVITNTSYFPMAKKEKKPQTKKLILGYIGDVKRKKGLIYLLEAIKLLKNEDLKLQITGKVYKDEAPAYKAFIKSNHLERRVKFMDEVERNAISNRFNACDVIVLPTISDGCPNIIFEAMKLGKPIISTNNIAISQILENGKDALLVEQRSAKALADAIKRIIDNRTLLDKLSINAQQKEKVLKPRIEAGQYYKLYTTLSHKQG